jgi:hypothetical protein
MAEDDQGGRVERTIEYFGSLRDLLLDGPKTLRKINARIKRNEKRVAKMKLQVAKNTATLEAIMTFVPQLKFDQDTSDSGSK